MFSRLFARSARFVNRAGRLILARLRADTRLSAAADQMATVQSDLEAALAAYDAALATEGGAFANRRDALRVEGGILREIGFTALSRSGNHHDADPYLYYFPEGYGNALLLAPEEQAELARVVLDRLEAETDPKIAAYRDELTGARNALIAAEQAYVAVVNARREAFARARAEKRNWVRGVKLVHALAEAACPAEPAYVRWIFAPVNGARHSASTPEEEPTEAARASGEPAAAAK